MAWQDDIGWGRRLFAAGCLAAGLFAVALLGRRLSGSAGTASFAAAPTGIGSRGLSKLARVNHARTPEAVSVIAATFRRVAEQDTGTIHMRLGNPTGRTLRTSSWRVNGAPVDLAGSVGDPASHRERLELLGDAGSPDTLPVSRASSNKHELYSTGSYGATIWAWGAAAWGLPPGESDLVLKLPRPPQGAVRVDGRFEDGQSVRADIAPLGREFAISYVATDVERQRTFVYAENRGTTPLHPV